MSILRRFFLVFNCFGNFRSFSINSFLISNRGTTAGEKTPFIILCMYVTLRTTKFTHSDDNMLIILIRYVPMVPFSINANRNLTPILA